MASSITTKSHGQNGDLSACNLLHFTVWSRSFLPSILHHRQYGNLSPPKIPCYSPASHVRQHCIYMHICSRAHIRAQHAAMHKALKNPGSSAHYCADAISITTHSGCRKPEKQVTIQHIGFRAIQHITFVLRVLQTSSSPSKSSAHVK